MRAEMIVMRSALAERLQDLPGDGSAPADRCVVFHVIRCPKCGSQETHLARTQRRWRFKRAIRERGVQERRVGEGMWDTGNVGAVQCTPWIAMRHSNY